MNLPVQLTVLTFSLLTSCVVLSFLYLIWKNRLLVKAEQRVLLGLIVFFAVYKLVAYYVIPALFRQIMMYKYINEIGVDVIYIMQLYLIEMLSWMFWSIGFVAVLFLAKTRDSTDYKLHSRRDDYYYVLILWVLVYVVYILLTLMGSADIVYLELIKVLVLYGGPPAAVTLFIYGIINKKGEAIVIGLIGWLISLAFYSTRGALIYSVLFSFFVYTVYKRNYKNNYLLIGMIGITLFSSFVVFKGLPQLSFEISNEGRPIFSSGISDHKGDGEEWYEKIASRFGASTRYSTAFIIMYDRGDSAGYRPIVNSMIGVLPRSLDPDKPIPTTVNGSDKYSAGMYMIQREFHGGSTYNMVEFSTGGHAYWEYGWLGVVSFGLISGMYIAFCVYLFSSTGLLSLPLMMLTFRPWGYVDPKPFVSDIIVQFYHIILPFLLIVLVLYLIRRVKSLVLLRLVCQK